MKEPRETVNFSIFDCKSVEMAITSTGMVSEDQKIGAAKDR